MLRIAFGILGTILFVLSAAHCAKAYERRPTAIIVAPPAYHHRHPSVGLRCDLNCVAATAIVGSMMGQGANPRIIHVPQESEDDSDQIRERPLK